MGLLAGVLELAAPTRCAGCDRPGSLLCERCAGALVRIDLADACPRCGAPDGRARCEECGRHEFAFPQARCAGVFTHPLARMVVLFKDGGERRLGRVLGALVAEVAADWAGWADAVAPVPASHAAVLRRGFDHGALLAGAIAAELELPAARLLGVASRSDQRRLGRQERAANARHGVSVLPRAEVPRRVLLVDDVFTTGATLDAASRVLLAAGVQEVRVAAVARACEW